MNEFDWGFIIASGLSLIGYFVSLELRIRNLQNALIQNKQKLVDLGIASNIHALSYNDLADKLNADLGRKP